MLNKGFFGGGILSVERTYQSTIYKINMKMRATDQLAHAHLVFFYEFNSKKKNWNPPNNKLANSPV